MSGSKSIKPGMETSLKSQVSYWLKIQPIRCSRFDTGPKLQCNYLVSWFFTWFVWSSVNNNYLHVIRLLIQKHFYIGSTHYVNQTITYYNNQQLATHLTLSRPLIGAKSLNINTWCFQVLVCAILTGPLKNMTRLITEFSIGKTDVQK